MSDEGKPVILGSSFLPGVVLSPVSIGRNMNMKIQHIIKGL
jgi:hypothetical protein